MSKFISVLTSIATLSMAAIPLSAIGGMAHAAEARIHVGDLNLASPADAQRFARRVDAAAASVCNDLGVRSVSLQSCRVAIREEATEKLGVDQREALRMAANPTTRVAGF